MSTLPVAVGQTATQTWTSSTSQNTAISLLVLAYQTALVTLQNSGTITGGTIGFQGYDGINWYTLTGIEVPGGTKDTSYTLSSGSLAWYVDVTAFSQFRVILSGAITGTGSCTLTTRAIASSSPTLVANSGGGGGGTQYTDGGTPPTHPIGTMPIFNNGGTWSQVSTSAGLPVNVVAGSGGGLSVVDEASWTAGTSNFVPGGGVYNDSATALTSGQQGTQRLTPNRAEHVNLRNNSGTEIGTTSNPISDNLSQVGGSAYALGQTTMSASLPVTIASDQSTIAAYIATRSSGGGTTLGTGSIGNTATSIKGSAGQIYRVVLYNNNSTVSYCQFFNVASGSVTVGSTAPTESWGIPPNGGLVAYMSAGWYFSTAITIAITTTRAGSTSPSNTVDYNISGV